MTRALQVADLFCGAGGSSTGAARALAARGLRMDLVAVNHWPVAIATHEKNHPTAKHFGDDIFKREPQAVVPGGRLDLLMASPTCTFHSRARGGKPISWDQRYGRMTPTQVVRWLRELDVATLLVENVPEFVEWGPVHPGPRMEKDGKTVRVPAPPVRNRDCLAAGRCEPGKACPRRRGIYFRAWVAQIRRLGYALEWRVLNAADYGDATTRRRFFLIGRKDGAPIRWPAPTHGAGAPERWRGAREVIDWSLRGQSIFDRKRPLSPKTIARIYAGAVRFGWPEPFLVVLRQHMDARSIDDPLPALTAGGTHVALVQPGARAQLDLFPSGEALVLPQHGTNRARAASEPVPVVTTTSRGIGLAEPLLVRSGMHQSNALCVRDTADPLPTITTDGGLAVVEPFVLNRHGDNGACRAHAVDAPVPTADCRGAGYLVEPFVCANRTNNVPKPVTDPVPGITTTCGGGNFLVEPLVLQVNQGGDRARNIREVSSPLPTVVTRPSFGVVEPLVLPQGGGGAARPVGEPLATIATDGAHALVAPYYGQSAARPAAEPLPTVTTRDRFGLVTPVTHHDASQRTRTLEAPLPTVTAARRGELALIVPAHGERKGQAPRVHSVDAPTPTICATGRVQLVEGQAEPRVDVLFRMLQPHELAAAMGFEDYEFTGTKEEVTRQIGNAVPVRTAAALVGAILSSAPARRRTKRVSA